MKTLVLVCLLAVAGSAHAQGLTDMSDAQGGVAGFAVGFTAETLLDKTVDAVFHQDLPLWSHVALNAGGAVVFSFIYQAHHTDSVDVARADWMAGSVMVGSFSAIAIHW